MKSPLRRNLPIVVVMIALLTVGIALYAGNVSHARHPNLAAAQTLIEKAVHKISEAQEANEFDMNGHAAKAKSLLDDAYSEIKLAAESANRNK
jgi:hypothetical protein